MSEKLKPPQKKGESLLSLVSRALLGHPINGVFDEGDGYVMMGGSLTFDEDVYNASHPDNPKHITGDGPCGPNSSSSGKNWY